MDKFFNAYYQSPIGKIHLQADDDALILTSFMDDSDNERTTTLSTVLKNTIRQLDAYFKGTLKSFDLPLKPEGTSFQQTVWKELANIPFGQTITYLQLAKRLGNVKVIRAAASANGKNPIGIIIPCHRVIGTDGKLTGYAGGLHRKQWLLQHEAKTAGHPVLYL
jgi:methylated-DNA-[protein]-cysteine S-methyltransferase